MPADPRVRQRAAHDGDVRRSGQLRHAQVVGIDAAAGQQPRIFGPQHPRAHDAHRFSVVSGRASGRVGGAIILLCQPGED